MQEIYFDNAATTKVLPEVGDLARHMMCEEYGNPSAMYHRGLLAERAVKEARERAAALIGARPQEIIFTSCGTEANNTALRGVMQSRARRGKHMLVSAVEHQSVLQTARALQEQGYELDLLPVDAQGRVDLAALPGLLRPDTVLVSVMLVNNEVGAIQPIRQLREALTAAGSPALLHVDAVQGVGKMPIDVKALGVDLLSASGHKLHGPKGVGFLYVRQNLKLPPLLTGGGQEGGWRSGTENTPGICGLGLAAQLAKAELAGRRQQAAQVRAAFLQGLEPLADWRINGPAPEGEGLPHILNISFAGVKSEVLLHMLEGLGLLVSAGAACSSHKNNFSHVLQAMGLAKGQIEGALRFSFSHLNTVAEGERAAELVRQCVEELRGVM